MPKKSYPFCSEVDVMYAIDPMGRDLLIITNNTWKGKRHIVTLETQEITTIFSSPLYKLKGNDFYCYAKDVMLVSNGLNAEEKKTGNVYIEL